MYDSLRKSSEHYGNITTDFFNLKKSFLVIQKYMIKTVESQNNCILCIIIFKIVIGTKYFSVRQEHLPDKKEKTLQK